MVYRIHEDFAAGKQRGSGKRAMSQENRAPRHYDTSDELSPEEREWNRETAAMIRSWMEQDDGYDDEVWPLIEEELKNSRMRCGE